MHSTPGTERAQEVTDPGLPPFGKESKGAEESLSGPAGGPAQGHEKKHAGNADEGGQVAAHPQGPLQRRTDLCSGASHQGQGGAEDEEGGQQIADPLDHPGSQLRGKCDLFLNGNQIRPHEFARPAKQDDGGEADGGGRKKPPHVRLAVEATEHDGPAECASIVRGQGQKGGCQQPRPAHPHEGGGEEGPVEAVAARMEGEQKKGNQDQHESRGEQPSVLLDDGSTFGHEIRQNSSHPGLHRARMESGTL